MTLIRYTLYLAAIIAGVNAVAAWVTAQLPDAGILAACSAAAVLIAEGIGYCQRRHVRRGREQVWERRELDAMTAEAAEDDMYRRCAEFVDTRPHHSPVWPFDAGSPE